ncbi:Nicotinate-nucleotide adenylyltransferase [Tepidimonas alkaliphilus]|uniref:Probable nicotinate-nucleotide adenylyltransferase n=1 Tax=Tepidimonas alkaliphilus TaxID=2588942 RepID=A0A554W8P4_9BURK|nr:nicotinate (nicotinamide) nucleotide adenylyltransferase [Tepidimonas alkaliphilus]TSE19944.1 Nicotinate-nucleotide adenylyltransferase [Tepidimonas alkaliphilus]
MNAAAPRRVGVFGGAFDPPHRVHRALARLALRHLGLDALHVIPTGHAWHKARALSPAAHRLAMCRLAFARLPGVVIDPCELARPGPSYTADTLAELRARHPQAQLLLLIGADQWRALPTWHRWRDVLALATPVVAARPGATLADSPLGAPPRTLPWPARDMSSTAVRAAAAAGADVAALATLVPAAVARYIVRHGLYRPGV